MNNVEDYAFKKNEKLQKQIKERNDRIFLEAVQKAVKLQYELLAAGEKDPENIIETVSFDLVTTCRQIYGRLEKTESAYIPSPLKNRDIGNG